MKRTLAIVAALLVAAANTSVLISVSRNRSEAVGGSVELTERELSLPPMIGESTAIFLELEWDSLSSQPEERGEPDWLDAPKLSELGFDCTMPGSDAAAKEYYGALPARLTFVVLEYEGEAWKKARPNRKRNTRLFVVDAGRDPQSLRQKHSDASRYIITRALVTVFVHEQVRKEEGTRFEPGMPPRQPARPQSPRGRIAAILPRQIFVPFPHGRALGALRRRGEPSLENESDREPRFAVGVSWGKHFEPWVTNLRRLPAASPPNTSSAFGKE
ncbi:MAG: DUF4824 family protein [Verrucomicrobia bacterium]|nr:DUF4824 family protein [Verrucomicrobiota bacterium]